MNSVSLSFMTTKQKKLIVFLSGLLTGALFMIVMASLFLH